MARICTSVVSGWTIETFDCSRNINPPKTLTFNGLATFQGGRTANNECPALWLAIDGVRTGQHFHPDGAKITINCQGLDTGPVDCLNGGCVPASTYGTPGIFPTLAACQSGCAKNSNCTGECVSAEEIAALQQAVSTLRSKLCG